MFLSLLPDSNWRVLTDPDYKSGAINHYAKKAWCTTITVSWSTKTTTLRAVSISCNGLSDDPYASRFHHFRDLYTPDSHQVGKMRTDYRLRVSYIVIYSRFQAKCPCGFRRCLLLHCPYLRYSDSTLRVLSGYIFQ